MSRKPYLIVTCLLSLFDCQHAPGALPPTPPRSVSSAQAPATPPASATAAAVVSAPRKLLILRGSVGSESDTWLQACVVVELNGDRARAVVDECGWFDHDYALLMEGPSSADGRIHLSAPNGDRLDGRIDPRTSAMTGQWGRADGERVPVEWQPVKGEDTSPSKPTPGEPDDFVGFLGSQRVLLHLTATGSRLSGTYRAPGTTRDVQLTGDLDRATGAIRLSAADPSGAESGTWEGALFSGRDLVGRWSPPDSSRSSAFALRRARIRTHRVDIGVGASIEVAERDEDAPGCGYSIQHANIVGVPPNVMAPIDEALNQLAPGASGGRCDPTNAGDMFAPEVSYGSVTLRVGKAANGYASVFAEGMWPAAAHEMVGCACVVVDAHKGTVEDLRSMLTSEGSKRLDRMVAVLLAHDRCPNGHLYGNDDDDCPFHANGKSAGFMTDPFDDSKPLHVVDGAALCVGDAVLEVHFQPNTIGTWADGAPTYTIPVRKAKPLFQSSSLVDALF